MSLLVYLIISFLLASFIKKGLKRLDGPPISDQLINNPAFMSRSLIERESLLHESKRRKSLRGGWFRVLLYFSIWFALGYFLFTGQYALDSMKALVTALPGSFLCAIALYNLDKTLGKHS